jgi:hypothetical protein
MTARFVLSNKTLRVPSELQSLDLSEYECWKYRLFDCLYEKKVVDSIIRIYPQTSATISCGVFV